jgi:3-deoxy-D-manno-octulosonate 8-phosphate phosphatase KdsC-like HAD superfamily phosphatase
VARYLSARYDIPPQVIATIGDMPNDVLMFAHSGLSIAMGNASPGVQRAARRITTSNEEEGFANAVERFILGKLTLRPVDLAASPKRVPPSTSGTEPGAARGAL